MASPPFNISQATPGDSDIVSQYPSNERTNRDVIESWLLVNHNNLGQHKYVELPYTALVDTPAGQANVTTLYADQYGALHILKGTVDEYASVPPGSIIYMVTTDNTTLYNGYLWPNGAAVSRATFADLFSKIGTQFGIGDGSTTFNLPDIRGRILAATNTLGGTSDTNRISSGSIDGTTQGSAGGTQSYTLLGTNLPVLAPWTISSSGSVSGTVGIDGLHSHIGTTDAGSPAAHTHNEQQPTSKARGTQGGADFSTWSGDQTVTTGPENSSLSHTHSFTTAAAGSHNHAWSGSISVTSLVNGNGSNGIAFSKLGPMIIVRAMIKY